MSVNAHNLYFNLLREAWQPILRQDGFGAFNAHRLEWRQGYSSRTIVLDKDAFGVRVELWHSFNGLAVREVPFSPQSGTYTHLHVLMLLPDLAQHRHYQFLYGDAEPAIRGNVALLVDAYRRIARPFFRLE